MEGGFLKRWKAFLGNLLDLAIPPSCLVCGTRIDDQKEILCSDCESRISMVSGDCCPKCGAVFSGSECSNCARESFAFDATDSLFRYAGSIKDLIHQLKYNGYVSPAGYLALHLADYLQGNEDLHEYDLVCPIPLHRVRKRERGYNQSELIAYAAAKLADLPYAQPLKRSHYTRSQTMLSRENRKKNLHGAFRVTNPKAVKDKKVILVDDVFTTGSTLHEAAKELKAAGASKVAAITVAKAQ